MSATLVGQAVNQAFATSCTVARTTTAGNLLVLIVQHQSNTTPVITDSGGGTWTLAGTTNTSGSTAQRLMSIYYRANAPSITAATVTVGSITALNMILAEFSTTTPTSTTARTVTTANITTGSVTSPVTANAGDLVVSAAAWGATGRAETLSGGFTALTPVSTGSSPGTYLAAAYLLSSAAGSVGPTWSLSPSATTGIVTVAFQTAVSTNATPTAVPGSTQIVAAGTQIALSGGGTDTDGTIASYAWTCTSYPGSSAPALSSSAAQNPTVTLTDPGAYTFSLTVVDNGGASSAPATVNHYAYPPSGTAAQVKSVSIGSWVLYGAPASAPAGLNDGLATTGLESPAGPTGQPVTLVFQPTGPGAVTLSVSGYSNGGTVARKIDVYKADGTTKIYDDASFTLPTSDAAHTITLDSTALAAIPATSDRVALVAIVKDTAG